MLEIGRQCDCKRGSHLHTVSRCRYAPTQSSSNPRQSHLKEQTGPCCSLRSKRGVQISLIYAEESIWETDQLHNRLIEGVKLGIGPRIAFIHHQRWIRVDEAVYQRRYGSTEFGTFMRKHESRVTYRASSRLLCLFLTRSILLKILM